jgi:hypothetical protein
MCREHFGVERSGVVFGWVFAAHMVGAGIAASFAGAVRAHTGDYRIAWLTAGLLCLLAALSFFSIRARGEHAVLTRTASGRMKAQATAGSSESA